MGEFSRPRLLEFPRMPLIWSAFLDSEDNFPFSSLTFPGDDIFVIGGETPIYGDSGSFVASEECSVDFDSSDSAG
jgi:hypothetical protein